jgi:hypothetical protein
MYVGLGFVSFALFFCFLRVCVVVLGFELLLSHLLGKCSKILATWITLFCVGYFRDSVW